MGHCHTHLHHQSDLANGTVTSDMETDNGHCQTFCIPLFRNSLAAYCLTLESEPSFHWFYHSWKCPQRSHIRPQWATLSLHYWFTSLWIDICHHQTTAESPTEGAGRLFPLRLNKGHFQLRHKKKKAYGPVPLVAFPQPQTCTHSLSMAFQKSNQRKHSINSSTAFAFQNHISQIQPLGS